MLVKIIVIKDKPIGQHVVTKDVTTIGRKSECDISIKDPAVSGNHARIQKVGEHYLVQDMGSTNGVYISGRPIKQQVLKHEDLLIIGEHQLKILLFDEIAPTSDLKSDAPVKVELPPKPSTNLKTEPEKAGPVKREETVLRGKTKELSSSPLSIRRETGHGYLIYSTGPKSGAKIPLEEGLTTIGEPGVQIAAISKRPQGHFIIHVDGGKDKNKVPLVNGEPTGFKSHKLEPGDTIEVAGNQMEYYIG
ncbi:MAG: pSer/pThr/pTyr-binding forkhead associated (FHA) protein [Candidatus Azotimanducaceae bacterium]|jgi:pSer/pThr/pTyr-binding forkhead associated (FHA) protein